MRYTTREKILIHGAFFMLFLLIGYAFIKPQAEQLEQAQKNLEQAKQVYHNQLVLLDNADNLELQIQEYASALVPYDTLFFRDMDAYTTDLEVRRILADCGLFADSLTITPVSAYTLSAGPFHNRHEDSYNNILSLYETLYGELMKGDYPKATLNAITANVTLHASSAELGVLLDTIIQEERAVYVSQIKAPSFVFPADEKRELSITMVFFCLYDEETI